MKYLLVILFFFCPVDTIKKDKDTVILNEVTALSREFKFIQAREKTIKELDTLDMKFNKILELLNDSTIKK